MTWSEAEDDAEGNVRQTIDKLLCVRSVQLIRDYPDFFKNLYKLFDRNLMHVKYRARFFSQVDVFLSSPYVPHGPLSSRYEV